MGLLFEPVQNILTICSKHELSRGEVVLAQKRKVNRFRDDIVRKRTDLKTGEITVADHKVTYFPARFDKDIGYLFWTQKKGVRVFSDITFPTSMSKSDIGNLAILSKHVWHGTNVIGRGTRKGGAHPYSATEIGKILDLTVGQAERFLKRAHRHGVIKPVQVPFGKHVEIQYYMNPLYYFAGNRLHPNLYLLFRKELDEYLPDWVKEEFANTIADRKTSKKKVGASK